MFQVPASQIITKGNRVQDTAGLDVEQMFLRGAIDHAALKRVRQNRLVHKQVAKDKRLSRGLRDSHKHACREVVKRWD